MPKVYNKAHRNAPPDAVYIGRPSKWGNPFSHDASLDHCITVRTRQEAIDSFSDYLAKRPGLRDAIKKELKGKDLVCWCAPLSCHGDILLKIANE